MDLETDLERLLWHEIGHFAVDLIQSEIYKEYQVTELIIQYYRSAISENKWGGWVKITPSIKHNEMIEDFQLTSICLLSLLSGCIFQTIYFNRKTIDADLNKCFCMKGLCAGNQDFFSFFQINTSFRKRHKYSSDYIMFIEEELKLLYYEMILNDEPFLDELKTLISKYKKIIMDDYESKSSPSNYEFTFSEKLLEDIKEELFIVICRHSFYKNIKDLVSIIIEKMTIKL